MAHENEFRPVCDIHEENTTLLARVDAKLGTLIGLLGTTIVLWFPVIITGVVFIITLSGRVAALEKQIDDISHEKR